MLRIRRYISTWRAKILFVVFSILCLGSTGLFTVHALQSNVLDTLQASVNPTNWSPNPGPNPPYSGSVLLYSGASAWGGLIVGPHSGVSSDHGFKHVLKNEQTSNIRRTVLKVYYNTQNEANSDRFLLQQDHCNFSATNGNPPAGNNNANNFYIVRRHNVSFYINGQERFRNEATSNATQEATSCGYFNRWWDTLGGATFDSATGLWLNSLEFRLEGNRYGGGGQKVLFQVGSGNGGKISIDSAANEYSFGIGESPGGGNTNLSLVAGIPFGLTCTYQGSGYPHAGVSVYDPDPTGFGNSYLFIMKRDEPTLSNPNPSWQRFSKEDYAADHPNISDSGWDGSKWTIDNVADGDTATVYIANYEKNKDYLLVYDNPHASGKNQPTTNILSVGLPGESISVSVSCQYNLTPSVSQPTPATVSPAGVLTVSGAVSNAYSTDNIAGNHSWNQYVAKFSHKPSPAEMDLTDTSAAFNPCDVIPSNNRYGCVKFGGDYTYPAQKTTGDLDFTTDPNDPPGSYICFITRVDQPTQDTPSGTWRYSDMKCSLVAKKPKVQVLGSDLKVNGKISTSLSESISGGTQKTFGSWVEYGVFSTGTNQLASSGAGLSGGSTFSVVSKAQWSKLTFSNKINQPTDLYGNYQPELGNAPTVFARMTATTPVNLANSGVYDIGNATLGGSTNIDIPAGVKGKTLILRGDNITIDGNISVDNNSRTSVGEISQIVILANTIKIMGSVTKVDAWLLTQNSVRGGGNINTCSDVDVSAPLTVGICGNPLEVNGAVMTNHLYLRRTAGAGGTDPEKAAEVFRLRPDAQLWAYNYANQGDRAQTVYVTELPPRF